LPTTSMKTENRASIARSLISAIRRSDLDEVAHLLKSGVSPRRRPSFWIRTDSPICVAADVESPEIIETLIQHGAPVDELGSTRYTALQISCAKRNYECAELLLRHGACVNRYRLRPSPVSFAAYSGDPRLVALLLSAGGRASDVWRNGIASALQLPPLILQALIERSDVRVPDFAHTLMRIRNEEARLRKGSNNPHRNVPQKKPGGGEDE
jgi:ankyrin repeat protein